MDIEDDLKQNINKIKVSKLYPFQKLICLRKYILPRYFYILRNFNIPIKILQNMDQFVNASINEILNINKVSRNWIHRRWRDGGLNIQSLENEYYINKLTILYRLSKSKDELIKKVFKFHINDELERKNVKTVSVKNVEEVKNYNKEYNILLYNFIYDNSLKKIITEDNKNISELNNILQFCIYSFNKLNIECMLIDNQVVLVGKSHIMKNVNMKNIMKHLHKELYTIYNSENYNNNNNNNCEEEINVMAQNFKTEILRNNKRSNQYILQNNCSEKQFSLLYKMRCNIMKNYGKCRRCNNDSVNYKHILQNCFPMRNLYTKRRNVVVEKLKQLIKYSKYNYYEMYDSTLDKIIDIRKEENKLLRPDIVLFNEVENKVIMIEVAVSYVSNKFNGVELTEKLKREKYNSLIEELKQNNFKVEFYPIVFESTGIYFKNRIFNDMLIKVYNIRFKTIKNIVDYINNNIIRVDFEIVSKYFTKNVSGGDE